jgi:hypothetical protein
METIVRKPRDAKANTWSDDGEQALDGNKRSISLDEG